MRFAQGDRTMVGKLAPVVKTASQVWIIIPLFEQRYGHCVVIVRALR